MRENRDFVVPVNILTPFAHTPFSWAARHTTVCLDFEWTQSKQHRRSKGQGCGIPVPLLSMLVILVDF